MTRHETISIIRNVFFSMARPNEHLVDNVVFNTLPELFGQEFDPEGAAAISVVDEPGHRFEHHIFLCEDAMVELVDGLSSIDMIVEEIRHTILHERRHIVQDLRGEFAHYDDSLEWGVCPFERDADHWAAEQLRHCYA